MRVVGIHKRKGEVGGGKERLKRRGMGEGAKRRGGGGGGGVLERGRYKRGVCQEVNGSLEAIH